jgi:hypothetical protein
LLSLAQRVHESHDQLGNAVAEQLGTHPQLAEVARRLPKITSRSTSIDHGSPSTSMAALIAHPDLGGR